MNQQIQSDTNAGYGSMPSSNNLSKEQQQQQQEEAYLLQQSHKWTLGAGVLYTVIIICGIISEVGLRGSLIDFSDADATIANIQESPASLRWSLLLDLTMSVSDVALSILLGAVLWVNGADKLWTVTAMVFRIVQQAILATNLLHLFVASLLLDPTLPAAAVLSLSSASASSAMNNDNNTDDSIRVESLVMLFLYLHKYGYAVALVFFGISMCLLGGVIWTSRIFPQWLGAAASLAGLGYLFDSTFHFLVNGYTGNGVVSNICMLPVFVAEFGLAGWLLFQKPVVAVMAAYS